jgi:hypothetical protein
MGKDIASISHRIASHVVFWLHYLGFLHSRNLVIHGLQFMSSAFWYTFCFQFQLWGCNKSFPSFDSFDPLLKPKRFHANILKVTSIGREWYFLHYNIDPTRESSSWNPSWSGLFQLHRIDYLYDVEVTLYISRYMGRSIFRYRCMLYTESSFVDARLPIIQIHGYL